MTPARRLPYFTFAGLLALGVLFTLLSLAYERRTFEEQGRQIDPSTGTWRPSYDWQADNRRLELNARLRVGLLWVLVAHGVFNAMYTSAVIRGWRGLLQAFAFLALSGFLALILVVGRIGPALIG